MSATINYHDRCVSNIRYDFSPTQTWRHHLFSRCDSSLRKQQTYCRLQTSETPASVSTVDGQRKARLRWQFSEVGCIGVQTALTTHRTRATASVPAPQSNGLGQFRDSGTRPFHHVADLCMNRMGPGRLTFSLSGPSTTGVVPVSKRSSVTTRPGKILPANFPKHVSALRQCA